LFCLIKIVQRRKHPVIISDNDLFKKCILNKTRKDDKFGIIIDCRYFIKKIHYKNNEIFANIHEGDEVIKVKFHFFNELRKRKRIFVNQFRSMKYQLIV
jgi:hypothetical protein